MSGLPRAPVEPKVAAFTGWGSLTGFITWLLEVTVLKGHLSPDVAQSLPGVVGLILGFMGAYLAPHQPRTAETVAAVYHAMGDLGQEQNTLGWTQSASQPEAAGSAAPWADPGHDVRQDVADTMAGYQETGGPWSVPPASPPGISAADLGGREEADPYTHIIHGTD